MSSVDSVAGDPDNACRGGPVRKCPVRLRRGEVSPCQGGAESARPEHCRQRTKGFPWIETAPRFLHKSPHLAECVDRSALPSFLDSSFAKRFQALGWCLHGRLA